MARALPPIRAAAVLLAGLAATAAVSAGGGAGSDAGRRSSNSFTLLVTATAPASPTVAAPAGIGIAPKAVVRNPYNVPLMQNAGSLRAGR